MPTNQKRHRCIRCGSRRVEKYMRVEYVTRFSHVSKWRCVYCAPMEFETCNGVHLLQLSDTPGLKNQSK